MVVLKKPISFEWDLGNIEKNHHHGVENSEAEEVFFDPGKLLTADVKHSQGEPRYILIGKTKKQKWIFIVLTIRYERVRIISARYMHKKEVKRYEKAT